MKIVLTLFVLILPLYVLSQDAENAFHKAANLYIDEKNKEAKETLDDAMRKYPNDPKLNALRNKIKEDKKKEDEQKDKQDQKKDQQNKDQKDQEQKDQKDKKDQDKKNQQDQNKKDQEKKDQKEKKQGDEKKDDKDKKDNKEIPPSVSDKLKEMQMSEEKAKMILEAMKHQEIQYLQQNKRKATKPKDRSKPDW